MGLPRRVYGQAPLWLNRWTIHNDPKGGGNLSLQWRALRTVQWTLDTLHQYYKDLHIANSSQIMESLCTDRFRYFIKKIGGSANQDFES